MGWFGVIRVIQGHRKIAAFDKAHCALVVVYFVLFFVSET